MIHSMTGYATRQGSMPGYRWSFEVRSVNGKTLSPRFRLPEWIDGLEADLRTKLDATVKRGSLTLGLRVMREEGDATLALNEAQLAQVLRAMLIAETQAQALGVQLAPATAAQVLGLRGVMEVQGTPEPTEDLKSALIADAEVLFAELNAMRAAEGTALEAVVRTQLAEIAELAKTAEAQLEQQRRNQEEAFVRNLDRVLQATAQADPTRVAQEIATLSIASDVREEIDRLKAHVSAACALLDDGGVIGKKLDFLCIEFNREANTLCSKAQMPALSETGLALKVVIDQMREQIQNIE